VLQKDVQIISKRIKERLVSGEISRFIPQTLLTKEGKELQYPTSGRLHEILMEM
jgi:hypothetical protein